MQDEPRPRRTLAALARGRDNHLNLLRALAASLVIYTHAYGSTGHAAAEPLVAFSGKSFGSVAVDVFFVVSGFLVAKSWQRSRGLVDFALARALRIYPGLWVCVCFCVAVVGPVFTTHAPADYFADPATARFVVRNLTVLPFGTLGSLRGVFESLPETTLNLPLWTLPFELKMYALLAMLGSLRWLERRGVVAALVLVSGAIYLWHAVGDSLASTGFEYARFVFFFFAGTLAYLHRDRVPAHAGAVTAALVALGVLLAGPWSEFREAAIALATPYVALAAAVSLPRPLLVYNRVGDYSYGLYIYGFPVQQAFEAWSGARLQPAQNLWYSLPVALLLAMLSWHLVERRALDGRHVLGRGARAGVELS